MLEDTQTRGTERLDRLRAYPPRWVQQGGEKLRAGQRPLYPTTASVAISGLYECFSKHSLR